MSHHHQSRRRASDTPDLNETKAHIFVAGHELLKAAEGVLKFCKTYVEETSRDKSHPQLLGFFSKAITVAGELGTSMVKGSPVRDMMNKVTRPFCDSIEREMQEKKVKEEPRHTVKKKTTKRKKK
jgi:hypothetical protein